MPGQEPESSSWEGGGLHGPDIWAAQPKRLPGDSNIGPVNLPMIQESSSESDLDSNASESSSESDSDGGANTS